MKTHSLIAASFLLMSSALSGASIAQPARAGMENLGTVDISGRPDRDIIYNRFGGPVEGLRLRASDSDIECRSIVAKFGNGRSRQLYSGRLIEGRGIDVDVPGDSRQIVSLAFNCRASERWGGRVRILANVGRYRAEWTRSPDWSGYWSKLFNSDLDIRADRGSDAWRGPTRLTNTKWAIIGEERFDGRRDREVAYAGSRGDGLRAIALMPIEADAQCGRVRADFERGPDQNLNVADRLRRGEFNRVDLPGNRRDLVKLSMICEAEGRKDVTIRLYAMH